MSTPTVANPFASGNTDSFQQSNLAAGTYGTTKVPGLKIQKYFVPGVDKATRKDGTEFFMSRPDKNGAMMHNFIVVATLPSKEQLAKSNGNEFLLDHEGTTFLKLTLHDMWLNPETHVLAFSTEESDLAPAFIAAGLTNQGAIDEARAYYLKVATDKLIAANTPDLDQEVVEAQYASEMKQVRIKVGALYRLQDWKHKGDKNKRDIRMSPSELVGVEFSGIVKKDDQFGPSIEDSGIVTCKM